MNPVGLRGFSATVNYFNVRYENQISSVLGNLSILTQSSLYSNLIIRNPSAELVQSLTSRLIIRGVPLANPTLIIDARPANLGATNTSGVDFMMNYAFSLAASGNVRLGLSGLYYFKYDVAQSATAPILTRLNSINNPVKYTLRGNLGWTKGPLQVNAYVNHVPSYNNDLVSPVQKVASWTTMDVDFAIDFGKLVETGWMKGATLNVNVQNLFNQSPPFANVAASQNQSGGFDVQYANPLGRLITIGLRMKI